MGSGLLGLREEGTWGPGLLGLREEGAGAEEEGRGGGPKEEEAGGPDSRRLREEGLGVWTPVSAGRRGLRTRTPEFEGREVEAGAWPPGTEAG